jgi:hypothetical protein
MKRSYSIHLYRWAAFAIPALAAMGGAAGPVVAQSGQTVVRVSNDVIRKADEFEPLGINNFGDAGGTKHSAGNIIFNSGFEPVTMRNLYRVIESGQDKGKFWITLDGPGTSNYQLFTTGTYSGAAMRAYRFLDGAGQPLPFKDAAWADGGKLIDTDSAKSFVPLFNTTVVTRGASGFPGGGWLAETPEKFADPSQSKEEKDAQHKSWRVYYEGGSQLRMDDVVIVERTFAMPDLNDFHPRTREQGILSAWLTPVGKSRFIPLPAGAPAEMEGGKGAMELTPDAGVAQLWNKLFTGPGQKNANWYGTLEKGLTYRYEVWAKVEGGKPGTLTFGFGTEKPDGLAAGYFNTKIEKTFPVTGQWQRVGFEFTAPDAQSEGPIEGAIQRYQGDGKLLLDNVKLQPVYAPGDADKPFVIYKRTFDELMSTQPKTGRKGALRVWGGLSDGQIDAFTDWTPDNGVRVGGSISVSGNEMVTLPKALTIIEATGDSPATRMVPWIIVQVMSTEDDYRKLVEYLAAPYDSSVDTPQSKPMASKRTQQRGNNRPWTADFRQVIVEFGNENWHNRKNENWVGFGRYGAIHQGGPEYGLWAKYMTAEMKKSPYWDDDKLKICLGGNYSAKIDPDGKVHGFGQEATIASGGVNLYHGHATYVGPRWETGDASQTTIDDDGVQKTLFGYRVKLVDEWTAQSKAQARLRQMGLNTLLAAYEGGPSGFGLKAKSPAEDRAGEYYGKSNAMGTAMLDAWLDAWRLGWTYQCYLSYQQGHWWCSHTTFSQGFRPSPGFLWQTIINQTMSNMDMVDVSVSGSPTTSFESTIAKGRAKPVTEVTSVQLIQAHAMRDEHRTSVAVVNLDLKRPHAFTVQLPPGEVKTVMEYTLTGNARDTNLDELKVKTEEHELDAKTVKAGAIELTLDPGRGAVYVFGR